MTTAQAQVALLNEKLSDTGTIGAWNREIDTAASSTQVAQANISNAAAELADAFLPAISDASDEVSDFSTWVKDNSDTVKTAIGIFSGLAAMIVVVNGIIKTAAALTAAYNAVMAIGRTVWLLGATAGYIFAGAEMAALWPIALIVLGIAALIAIIVLLVKNWDTVTAVMKKLWDWIKGVFGAVWGWLSDQIGKVVDALKRVWDWIQKIVTGGIDKIKDLLPFMSSAAALALAPAGATAAPAAPAGTGRAARAAGGVTINFNAPVTDPEATSRSIVRALRDSDRRNGRTIAWRTRRDGEPAW
jgi:phage-related minor tail protein